MAIIQEPKPQVLNPPGPTGVTSPSDSPSRPDFFQERLLSLDTYRGLIMVTLAFAGFGLAATANNHLKVEGPSPAWETVRFHFDHVQWVGCGYWDLIQPSFMFMVGVAMPFSYAKRRQKGATYLDMLDHALVRSLILIALGIFLISNWGSSTSWSLMNVLSQIGLGYTFLFLLWGKSVRTQGLAAALILLGTWLLYVLYPHAGIDLEKGNLEVGVTKEWAQKELTGLAPAWHKNANVGHAIDLWLLNLLPRPEPFTFNSGGYQTINFIPSLATMLFGLMCGELLRSSRAATYKLLLLIGLGLAGLGTGYLLDYTGLCPLVKRIWTPSWTLYSTGWCCLILAGLYCLIDVCGLRFWTFPLVVVGVNSIAIYCMGQLLKPWTTRTWKIHFGEPVFQWLGPLNEPFVHDMMVGLVFWLVCLWMYRNKVYVRI